MEQRPNVKRIVFLCSGAGGNLRFISAAVQRGWLGDARLVGVLSDRDCGANIWARANGVMEKVIDFSDSAQSCLVAELSDLRPDVIITNVHRVLREPVVESYRGRLVNLHYSLLPAFAGVIGAKPVAQALAYGASILGVTVHEVDETLDGGRPLVQAAIPSTGLRDLECGLMDVIFRCGCLALLAGVDAVLKGLPCDQVEFATLSVAERPCLFSGVNVSTLSAELWRNAQDAQAFWAEVALSVPASAPR